VETILKWKQMYLFFAQLIEMCEKKIELTFSQEMVVG